jgi:hypothetical protein
MSRKIEADYLIVGAGAMGMAFADTLLTETDATLAIVDRYHAPGGHWTRAYPFVRLHQPSVGYGVNSRPLGGDTIDQVGWNAGLYELATCGEVCAYFDQVMQQTFLPSGRVTYHPMCDYLGDGRLRSIVSGETLEVGVRRKTVDSTYQNVTVPAMRPPRYEVAPGATCAPLNALATLSAGYERFTIVGAGKTGIDACLWLLRQGVGPDRIRWIMPRDSWLIDRARVQPGPKFAPTVTDGFMAQLRATLEAASPADLFDRLAATGLMLRIDEAVRPTMYRCATVSLAELAQLRAIRDIVRLGRVRRIEAAALVLDEGTVAVAPDTLHVDCSADGLERRPPIPVFDGPRLTLQSVRTCQQVFSAALIAHVEAAYSDDVVKNALCAPIPHPDSDLDWLTCGAANARNEARWAEDEDLSLWISRSRLDWLRPVALPADPVERAQSLRQRRDVNTALAARLESLLAA